jgi:hypothetical protein
MNRVEIISYRGIKMVEMLSMLALTMVCQEKEQKTSKKLFRKQRNGDFVQLTKQSKKR